MTDLLEEAQHILSREHMPRDENTFTALWHVIRYLRATATAATYRVVDGELRQVVPGSFADPTGTYAEPSEAKMERLSVADRGDGTAVGDIGIWRDGFANGRSSAARELAERDERIRELEAKLKAWEPVVRNLNHEVGIAFDRAIDAYDAIPANLRPGEKA